MGRLLKRLVLIALFLVVGFYAVCALGLVYLRFLPPLFTTVQLQRQAEALIGPGSVGREYRFRPRDEISTHLRRAVVAAEDTRFFQHRGFDWECIREQRRQRERGRAPRGCSTITQQLVKNLFLTTHRSWIRKGIETTLTPLAEVILGKDRILELYVNVIEWGPGVYGAEAAARHHFDRPARDLTREQAASLAAVIPAPRTRRPQQMGWYQRIILQRMHQMGW
jgi:monofunctional glycosyltransferase